VMMKSIDNTLQAIVRFSLQKPDVESYQSLVNHMIDTIGCALGSVNAISVKLVSELYAFPRSTEGASVRLLTHRHWGAPEQIAFCNTAAIRYMDYNDTGVGGHPSDSFGAVLVAAQLESRTVRDVCHAMNIVYEVYAALRVGGLYGNILREKHVDQIQVVIAATLASGYLLKLSEEELANAVGMALSPCVPIRATRTGNISNWKAMATSHSSLSAILACRLAKKGITGPEKPFEGSGGLYQMLGIEALDLSSIGQERDGLSAVDSTAIKLYPANYNVQGPARALIEMREQCALGEVESIEIGLHWGGWHSQGGGAGDIEEKWNPKTRESAENSLAFVAAASFLDGQLSYDSFSETSLNRSNIKKLIKKVKVYHDQKCTDQHQGIISRWPSKITIKLDCGRSISRTVTSPLGHPYNPISWQEIDKKFRLLTEGKYRVKCLEPLVNQLDGVDERFLDSTIDDLLNIIHDAKID
jgi:2-methylcitrate dehydratase